MTIPIERPSWMRKAACAELDSTEVDLLFFPPRGGTTKEARKICARCPVVGECLEYGINQKFGVWGGTTERERRLIKQERALDVAS